MTQTKPRHKLSHQNLEDKTATCSVCGPVRIKLKKTAAGTVYGTCGNRVRAEKRKTAKGDLTWTRPESTSNRTGHGLSAEEARAFVAGKNCAICGKKVRMKADHCHKTGKLREPLCHYCNFGLGHFFDDPELLRVAADYIERHRDS